MADGTTKAIESIAEGDVVMAFSGRESPVPCRVQKTFKNLSSTFIQLDNGVRVTPEHPFLTEDGRFVPIADAIRLGKRIVSEDGTLVVAAGFAQELSTPEDTYNFTVEQLHTYIAGGFRVHNLSILHFAESGEIVLNQGWLPDGSQYSLSLTRDNVVVKRIGRSNIDSDPDTDLLLVEKTYVASGASIKESWTEFDTSDRPAGNASYEVKWKNEIIDGEKLGLILGPQLISILGIKNPFARLAANTVGTTVLSNAFELITDLGHSLFNDIRLPNGFENVSEFLLEKSFGDFTSDLSKSFQNQSASTIASLLIAEAAERLNIDGFKGQLFTTAGNTIGSQIANNVIDAVINNKALTESQFLIGFEKIRLLSSIGNALGSALAAKVGSNLVKIESVGEALSSTISGIYGGASGASIVAGTSVATGFVSSTVGSLLGSSLAKAIGALIFPGIGAFLGTIIGQTAGSKIFDFVDKISGGFFSGLFAKSVWHYQYVNYDAQTNSFVRGNDGSKNTTSQLRNGTYSISDAYLESLNEIIKTIGGTIDAAKYRDATDNVLFAYVGRNAPWDGRDDWRVVFGGGNNYVNSGGDVARIVRIAIEHQLSNLVFTSGDPLKLRALEAWKLELSEFKERSGDSLSSLMSKLQLADDVRRYEDNVVLVNDLIKSNPDSALALSWVATLMQWEGINAKAADTFISNAQKSFAKGDTDGGIYQLTRSLEFAPKRTATLKLLGEKYLANGEISSAIYNLQRFVSVQDADTSVWIMLGKALIQRNLGTDRQDGVYALERSIGIDQSNGETFGILAKAYYDAGDAVKGRAALARAWALGTNIDFSAFPKAGISDLVGYIRSAQLPNGAIRISLDPSVYDASGKAYFKSDPYFASQAIVGLMSARLLGDFDVLPLAEQYFSWYVSNIKTDGTIDVHWYYSDGTIATDSTAPDSNDSYASMFLLGLRAYRSAGGNAEFFNAAGMRAKIELVANLLLRLQQPNGLTTTFLDVNRFQALYTQDNSESHAGLNAVADLFLDVYRDIDKAKLYSVAATKVRDGILQNLIDKATGRFLVGILFDRVSKTFNQPILTDLASWYTGTTPVVWPIIYGVISPTSPIALKQLEYVYAAWDGTQKYPNGVSKLNWTLRTDSPAMALAVAKTGDTAKSLAAISTATQGPYPTFVPSPNLAYDVAVTSIGDTGFSILASSWANLVVSNTNDEGPGSLRNAINTANTLGGGEIIIRLNDQDNGFVDIDASLAGGDPLKDVWVIRPRSPLPALSGHVTISGFSQTWSKGDSNPHGPEIVLDGSLSGTNTDGLVLQGIGNVVEGISIVGFQGNGIVIEHGGSNRIALNNIGTDATGKGVKGNSKNGVLLRNVSFWNSIENNVISGNSLAGIKVSGLGSDANIIRTNMIGVSVDGLKSLGNSGSGVVLNTGANWNLVSGNVIGGNKDHMLILDNGSSGNRSEWNTELNGLPITVGTGDVGDGDTGILFPLSNVIGLSAATTSSFIATTPTSGFLNAWIDFNQDGDWSDAGEQIATKLPVASGSNSVMYTIPPITSAGTTFARFSLGAAGGAGATGTEVMDHAVTLVGGTRKNVSLSALELGAHQIAISNGLVVVSSGTQTLWSAPESEIAKITTLNNKGAKVFELSAPATNLPGTVRYSSIGKSIELVSNRSSIDLAELSADKLYGVQLVDLRASGIQNLTIRRADVVALNSSRNLRILMDQADTLVALSDWKSQTGRVENSVWVQPYVSGDATIEIVSASPWQNEVNPIDVNGDQGTSPLDVLELINQINANNFPGGVLPARVSGGPQSFYDPDGDGRVGPLDVLMVINELNRLSGGEGENTRIALNNTKNIDQLMSADLFDVIDEGQLRNRKRFAVRF